MSLQDLVTLVRLSREGNREGIHEHFDLMAEEFGQANWQRARREDPDAFFSAKFELKSTGEAALSARVNPIAERLTLRIEWPMFRWESDPLPALITEIPDNAVVRRVRGPEPLQLDISLIACRGDDDELEKLLEHAAAKFAWAAARSSGEEIKILVHSNRATYKRLEALKDAEREQAAPGAP